MPKMSPFVTPKRLCASSPVSLSTFGAVGHTVGTVKIYAAAARSSEARRRVEITVNVAIPQHQPDPQRKDTRTLNPGGYPGRECDRNGARNRCDRPSGCVSTPSTYGCSGRLGQQTDVANAPRPSH